jgi:hypothetical protein
MASAQAAAHHLPVPDRPASTTIPGVARSELFMFFSNLLLCQPDFVQVFGPDPD